MLSPEDTWQDWPRCPQCGQPRHAVCPICKCAADEMPLADYIPQPAPLESTQPQGESQGKSCGGGCCQSTHQPVELGTAPAPPDEPAEDPILLLCPQCDEAFAPAFYRQCQQCEHDFGEGVPNPAEEIVEAGGRALFVIFLLVALAAAILGYCWYLFRS